MITGPFTDVEFPKMHPAKEVAEHEVLMSFTNDSDAALFVEWWQAKGSAAFNKWAEQSPKD